MELRGETEQILDPENGKIYRVTLTPLDWRPKTGGARVTLAYL